MSRVMLVTGGSRGIGAATVREAVAAGWTVCLTYRQDEAAAGRLVAELGVVAVAADVSVETDVLAAFSRAAELGDLRAVVVNAGIGAASSRLEDVSIERVRRLLEVNVLGAVLCCREGVRRMSAARGGSGGAIVLVSSTASRQGSPGRYVDYAATKGAVDTLSLGLAREVAGDGIRVNVVRPGVTDTGIHGENGEPGRAWDRAAVIPMGRPGQSVEVARAIVWLSGDEASYCTGSILDVSGGL